MEANIKVYLKSGQTFLYSIFGEDEKELASKAREHEYQIIKNGYRHNGIKEHTWYGPHWIDKIKVIGINVPSNYNDIASGT